ncbi:hypothetical protein MHBO_001441 [Bonamia ostreae]|uniref:RNA-binding protein n=1 Tax=Bonamia ostreae TaxID=126728 RepID=A0ABV2AIY1_9EUKA
MSDYSGIKTNKPYFGNPTKKVVIREIDMFITEEDLNNSVARFTGATVQIQPPPYHELALAEFASAADAKVFVENREDPGVVSVKGKTLYLDYFQKGEDLDFFVAAKKRAKKHTDWVCKNCRYKNFARRDSCHLCQSPREVAEAKPLDGMPILLSRKFSADSMEHNIFRYGIFAREVLSVSGFPPETEKDNIRYTFAPVAAVKAVSVRKVPGSPPMAFVEFYDSAETDSVLRQHGETPFELLGGKLVLRLARDLPKDLKELYDVKLRLREKEAALRFDKDLTEYVRDTSSRVSTDEVSAWHRKHEKKDVDSERRSKSHRSHRRRDSSHKRRSRNYSESSDEQNDKRRVKTKNDEKTERRQNDLERNENSEKSKTEERFVYDAQSGFYFDGKSGYLFDPVTQIYCHAQSRSCFEWNAAKNEFEATAKVGRFGYIVEVANQSNPNVSVESTSVKIINSAAPLPLRAESLKRPRPSHAIPLKTPVAFKPQKQVASALLSERSSLQKTERRDKVQKFSKFGRVAKKATQLRDVAKATKIGHGVVVGHGAAAEHIPKPPSSAPIESEKTKLPVVSKFVADTKQLTGQLEFSGKKDFFDYERIACLLCKRGFKSLETMKRHAKQSDLHKKNIKIFEIKKAARDKTLKNTKSALPNNKSNLGNGNERDGRDERYRSNMQNKLKQRYLDSKVSHRKLETLSNSGKSDYAQQVRILNAQSCSNKDGTPNAIVK